MMNKPTWLKKADRNKPWKYKKLICPGEKCIEIEVYNFEISMFGEPTAEQVKEAKKWIDERMS